MTVNYCTLLTKQLYEMTMNYCEGRIGVPRLCKPLKWEYIHESKFALKFLALRITMEVTLST